MRVGWLADDHNPPGGAELTQAEFRAAAPEGVEIIECPPGAVKSDLDAYAVHNCVTYGVEDLRPLTMCEGSLVKYVNDLWPHGDPVVRDWLIENATLIFCSPLQTEKFDIGLDHVGDAVIPPPLDLGRFRRSCFCEACADPECCGGCSCDPDAREGTICVGAYMNPGKGGYLVSEWAEKNGPVDYHGFGPYAPAESEYVRHHGPVSQDDLPIVLSTYERFVFLPTAIEPFGRAVVEAWAAGCELVINSNGGARYWIEENPEGLDTAAEDFWNVVLA